jgi:hypothetical protein
MRCLRQSTAVTIPIGPFVDSIDGDTEETALSITYSDVKLSKNGGSFAAANSSATCTYTGGDEGHYLLSLTTSDTGTLGTLRVAIHKSGALSVWDDFMVMPASVWDALFASSGGYINADVQRWLGQTCAAVSVNGVPEVDITYIAGSAVSTSSAQLGVNVVNWKGSAAAAMTGDAYAVVSNVTYGNSALKALIDTVDDYIDTEVSAIKAKTDYLPSATAGSAGGLFIAGTNANTTVNFTGNLSGSVGSMGTTGMEAMADAFLNRNLGSGTDSGGRTVRNALRPMVNKWVISGSTLYVYKENDSTEAWSATLTTSSSAQAVVTVDPA